MFIVNRRARSLLTMVLCCVLDAVVSFGYGTLVLAGHFDTSEYETT